MHHSARIEHPRAFVATARVDRPCHWHVEAIGQCEVENAIISLRLAEAQREGEKGEHGDEPGAEVRGRVRFHRVTEFRTAAGDFEDGGDAGRDFVR